MGRNWGETPDKSSSMLGVSNSQNLSHLHSLLPPLIVSMNFSYPVDFHGSKLVHLYADTLYIQKSALTVQTLYNSPPKNGLDDENQHFLQR